LTTSAARSPNVTLTPWLTASPVPGSSVTQSPAIDADDEKPRVLLTPFVDKSERRQQILQHARDVFAKHGYHAAKIDDIVAAAGIARGTFYLYFTDKRAIFEEIVDGTFLRIGAAIVRVDTDHATRSVGEQVRDNIRAIVHTLLEDPATTKILLSDAVGLDPAFDRRLIAFYEETGKLLATSLSDGQALGIVAQGDARMFAIMTLGALKEILYQVIMRGLDYSEERIVSELYSFLCTGYLRNAR
jgi:AcrR family transcriptional regulator